MDEGLCELRLTRTYSAEPALVWSVLTEPGSLRRWLAEPGAIELERGGAFRVGAVEGRVRELEPERVLELDWGLPGEQPSVVRFELVPDGDGTRLVLDHRQLAEPVGMAYLARWTTSLERLEGMLR